MVVFRNRKINKLVARFDSASPAERVHLHEDIRELIAEGRSIAVKERNYYDYSTYSIWLGQLFVESRDPSDALRPFACAYITACLHGGRLLPLKHEAAEGLAMAYLRTGEFELAAECIIDVLSSDGKLQVIAPTTVLWLCANVQRESEKDIVSEFYRAVRDELRAGPGWTRAMATIIDDRFALAEHDYAYLLANTRDLVESDDPEDASLAHRVLAEKALAEGRILEAKNHVEHAISLAASAQRHPWITTPLMGLSARILHAAGLPVEALGHAVSGWSAVVPALLNCKDDFARDRFRWMAGSCIDVAMEIACERQDWNQLTDFIENSRLQVAKAAPSDRDEAVVAEFPDWVVEGSIRAIGKGAMRAGQHALGADWKSGKRTQVATSWRGESTLIDAVGSQRSETADQIQIVDAFDHIQDQLDDGAIAWFAAVRNSVLYWTLTDLSGSIAGGRVDLSDPSIARALTALRKLVLPDARPNSPEDRTLEADHAIDVLKALSVVGSRFERELMAPLGELVPAALRSLALNRTEDNPLRVLFTLPAELSAVPWAAIPIDNDIRLIERAELTLLTPTAIRADSPRPAVRTAKLPVVVSCSNPDGKLVDADPVVGEVTLSGNGSSRITVSEFVDALQSCACDNGGVLFIRSHLGSSSGAPYIADRGILFADSVLSARDLALNRHNGPSETSLPTRTVLSLCSGAGSGDTSGLALGLAAACRLSGSEEVVTSTFNIPDTRWGCAFDLRLAEAATGLTPMVTALRQLQITCLQEWRLASEVAGLGWDNFPIPLIWASFMVVL